MNLLVGELKADEMSQGFVNTSGRTVHLVHLRPHLYKHLAPAGSFYVQVQNYLGEKIVDTNSLTAAQISSSDYFHGLIRFDVNVSLLKGSTSNPLSWYRFELKSTGYTYSDSAFIGWCINYDNAQYESFNTIVGDLDNHLGIEFWELKNKEIKRVP